MIPRWLFERMCEQRIGRPLPSDRDPETAEKYQLLPTSRISEPTPALTPRPYQESKPVANYQVRH
ncbi:MAG: hypothetical protein WCK29_03980 [archaeon]